MTRCVRGARKSAQHAAAVAHRNEMLLPTLCSARRSRLTNRPSDTAHAQTQPVYTRTPSSPLPTSPSRARATIACPPRARARVTRVRAPPVLVPNYVPTWRNICSPFGSIARNKRSPFCSHLCSKSGNIFSIRRNKLWTISSLHSSRDWNKMFLSMEHKRERIVSSDHFVPTFVPFYVPNYIPTMGTFCSDLFRKKTSREGTFKRNKKFSFQNLS